MHEHIYIYVLFWNLVDWQKFVFPRLPNSHTPVHIYINHGRGPQNRMCVVSRFAILKHRKPHLQYFLYGPILSEQLKMARTYYITIYMDWLGSKKNAQISTGSDFVLASIPTQAPAHGAQQAQVSSHLASQGLPEGLHFGWFWQKLQFVSTCLLKLHIYIYILSTIYIYIWNI